MSTRMTHAMTDISAGDEHATQHSSDFHATSEVEAEAAGGTRHPGTDAHRSSVTNFLHPHIGMLSQDRGSGHGRLIVVSNRVALPRDVRAGGLALALKGALAEQGG